MFHAPIFMTRTARSSTAPRSRIAEPHLNHFNIYFAPAAATARGVAQPAAGDRARRRGLASRSRSRPIRATAFEENLGAAWFASGLLAMARADRFRRPRRRGARRGVRRHRAAGVPRRRHPRRAASDGGPRDRAALGADHAHVRRGRRARRPARLRVHPRLPGRELGPDSVACMTKHFPGGGPQRDGEDPHFPYGKDQVYPGGMFEYHLRVFEAAFAAGTAQIMPYYGRPVGDRLEEVGFGYNRDVITGLLRGRCGFDGVVCTDWALVTDTPLPDGSVFGAKCWGVEELERRGPRLLKILEAGCDQLGGEELPEVLVELVRSGAHRRGAHRRLRSAAAARQVPARPLRRPVRRSRRGRAGVRQRRSSAPQASGCSVARRLSCQERRRAAARRAAGLRRRRRPYDGARGRRGPRTPTSRSSGGTRRSSRARTASSRRCSTPATSTSSQPELDALLELARRVPTVLVLHLERPAVIPELVAACAAVVAVFGASDAAVSTSLFGRVAPKGGSRSSCRRRWRRCASSCRTFRATRGSLFRFGHGLDY